MEAEDTEKNTEAVVRATVGISPEGMRKVRFLAADRNTSAFQVMSEAVVEVANREFKKLGISGGAK